MGTGIRSRMPQKALADPDLVNKKLLLYSKAYKLIFLYVLPQLLHQRRSDTNSPRASPGLQYHSWKKKRKHNKKWRVQNNISLDISQPNKGVTGMGNLLKVADPHHINADSGPSFELFTLMRMRIQIPSFSLYRSGSCFSQSEANLLPLV
jgi:hypothetical protein